jgi:hypothetical protein
VELPAGRLADRLRAEQYRYFRGETWLEEYLQSVQNVGGALGATVRTGGRVTAQIGR